jgi:hypothetical protein
MQGDFEIRDIDETIMDELLKRNKQYGYMIPRYPGDVCGHDILTIGRIPKIGKLYQQTFMDFYTNRAEAELYDYEVVSRTARYFLTKLYDSFFPDDWLFIYPRIITPNKSQFFRSKVQPLSYQKFLKENQISHRRRKNIPVVESFHKLIFDDFYIPLLRETSIHTLEELQSKLNHWLIEYNRSKHIKKAYCFGKTPDQTIEDFKVADNQKLPYMQLFYWP